MGMWSVSNKFDINRSWRVYLVAQASENGMSHVCTNGVHMLTSFVVVNVLLI